MEFLMVLAFFVAGMALSKVKSLKFVKRYNLLLWSTVVLLFVMGYDIGSNNDLFKKLPVIGLTSLELTISVMLFSFIFSYGAYLMKRKK